ncbi:hypothetical protein LEP1GSC064_2118 [Leptospira kirschneri serovar Grippotyphosa str. Moskva]|nr:hypothetical protein LEP1GSC044_2760 [Leptospira kirschneri serovar Grippotyphosa str. RM52]EKQ82772.1 hypothetical protein LEP1GSC064_2118 [Leptospira kirschneri serovar Grippotyphosa str. Moskva]EKR07276.1 hypothetical protein LEP1GSC122_2746 [Leptospira kirschneri serovar Valbuzzi str. 200702274]EMK07283.1 hypothetical protein LEP1GSC176_3625 [Leptospira kirschneri str. MMD1493]
MLVFWKGFYILSFETSTYSILFMRSSSKKIFLSRNYVQ